MIWGGIEVKEFAYFRLILECKFGDNPLRPVRITASVFLYETTCAYGNLVTYGFDAEL